MADTPEDRDAALLRLENTLARQLAEADDERAALQGVLQAMGETQGCDYGRFWQVDESAGVMRFALSWQAPGSSLAARMSMTEDMVFKPGVGMVGRVWESGRPVWVNDLGQQSQALGSPLDPGIGVLGACMFPVAWRGRTLGVMSFVSSRVQEPDKRLLETFRVVGSQVAQFLLRKDRDQEIAGLNAELEERVRQRTAQLQAANEELEAFAYSIAHDLRSPLTSIDGFTHMLESCDLAQEADKAAHYLRRIRAGVRQMSDLTDAMLSLARLSRVQIENHEVDLSALARAAVTQLREREPDRKWQLQIPDRLWTHGDPRLLSQAINNLVGNAWKFSGRKEAVAIRVGSEKREGETVYFVADHGAGFDMKYASRLFGAFQRLHSPSEFEGTGIGLALVHKIVSAHGGRIWADAKVGEGATFYFTLE